MDNFDLDFLDDLRGGLLHPLDDLDDFDFTHGLNPPPRNLTPRPPSELSDREADNGWLSARRRNVRHGCQRNPNIKVFNIHGLTGEHVWLSGSGVHIPWTSSKFSFSVPQLFDDGVDEKRFGEVAKDLLDHVAAEVGEENQDYVIAFLACDIGGTLLKHALQQASQSKVAKYKNVVEKTSLLTFLATPHRASATHPWHSTLFRLVWKYYPGRVDAWTPQQIDKLAALHQSTAERFEQIQNLYRFKIVNYYQDVPIDDGYELIIPAYAATLGAPKEVCVRAQRHHNLVGDFYIPTDRSRLLRHTENAQIAFREDYRAWQDIMSEASKKIVPLEASAAPSFKFFCEWLLESDHILRRWALDTEQMVSDAEPSQPDKKIRKRQVSRNLYSLSMLTTTARADCANLHSSLVGAIQSGREGPNVESDIFLGLSACSESREPVTISQILASLCAQLLESQPNLVDSLDVSIEEADIAIQFPLSTSLEALLWRCLKKLVVPDFLGRIYVMVYQPSNTTLSKPLAAFYEEILGWIKASEVPARFLFVSQVEPHSQEGSPIRPDIHSYVTLNAKNALVEPLEKDLATQLRASTLSPSSQDALQKAMAIQLSLQPFDSPLFIKLAEKRIVDLKNSFNPVRSVMDSIPPARTGEVRVGLMWLVYAARPLTPLELGVALLGDITDKDIPLDAERGTEEFVQLLSGSLEIRSGKVCMVLPEIVDLVTTTNEGEATPWYKISSEKANQALADLCMARMRDLKKTTIRHLYPSPEAPPRETTALLPQERDPLLMYAIENWYRHASRSYTPPNADLPPNARQDFQLWLHIRLSTASAAASLLGAARNGPDEVAWDPFYLSSHFGQPFDTCLSAILAGKALRASGVQNAWILIALAATRNGDDELSTQLLLRSGVVDSETILAISRNGGQALLCQLLQRERGSIEMQLEALLLDAVQFGHIQFLNQLIQEFSDNPTVKSHQTKNAMLKAWATTGRLEIDPDDRCWKLLFPLDGQQPTHNLGKTPLHTAATFGHINVAQVFVDGGVNVDQRSSGGETALYLASKYGQYSIVSLLLENGASRQTDRVESTPLHAACSVGHIDIANALLDNTERLSDLNSDDKTPLHNALEKGHFHVAMSLLAAIPSPLDGRRDKIDVEDSQWKSSLELAVDANHIASVRALLERGADANLKCSDGRSLVHHAVKYGYIDIMVELLKYDCELFETSVSSEGVTLLDSAATRGQIRILKLLLEHSQSSIYEDKIESALTLGCRWGQTEAVRLLLPHYTGNDHTNLAFGAADMGWADTVCLMLDSGANKNQQDESYEKTLLHIAAEKNYSGLAQALLLRGAQLEIQNSDGQTPLLVAAAEDSSIIVDLLIKAGANIDAVDSEGNTALYAAASSGHVQCVRVLLASKASQDIPRQYFDTCRNFVDYTLLHCTNEILSVALLQARRNGKSLGRNIEAIISPTAFSHFVQNGDDSDASKITILLEHPDLDVNMDIGEYGSMLHYAAGWGMVEYVKVLLQHGGDDIAAKVDINKLHQEHGTPLQMAAAMGRGSTVEVVSLLLSEGADLLAEGGEFGTPLHAAAFAPYYPGGYRVSWRDSGSKQIDVLQRLLQGNESAVHTVAGKFGTVLQAAAAGGSMSVVKFLIGKGCGKNEAENISGMYGTSLHAAVYERENSVASFLLSQSALGFSLLTLDSEGRLPTQVAAMIGNKEGFIQLLSSFSRGDDFELQLLRKKDFHGRNTLHFAAVGGSTDIIEFLLSRDETLLHEEDNDGWTALHWACRARGMEPEVNAAEVCARLLVERGASKTASTKRGWLPRDVAAWHEGPVDVVEVEEDTLTLALRDVTKVSDGIEGPQRVSSPGQKAVWRMNSVAGGYCDSCNSTIRGPRYKCKQCWDIDFCFKCFRHAAKIHYPRHKEFGRWDATPSEVEVIDVCAAQG